MSFKELYDALSNYWSKPPKNGFLFLDHFEELPSDLPLKSVLVTPSISHSVIGRAIEDNYELILTIFPLSYSSGSLVRGQSHTLLKDLLLNKLMSYSLGSSWMNDSLGGFSIFAQFLDAEETEVVFNSSGTKIGLLGKFPHRINDFIDSLSKTSPLMVGKARPKTKEKLSVLFYFPSSPSEYLTNDELKQVIISNNINVLLSSFLIDTLSMVCFETSISLLYVPLHSITNVICRKLAQLISVKLPKWNISFLPEKRINLSLLPSDDHTSY